MFKTVAFMILGLWVGLSSDWGFRQMARAARDTGDHGHQPRPSAIAGSSEAAVDEAMALRVAGRYEDALSTLATCEADARRAGAMGLAAWALHRRGDVLADLGDETGARSAYSRALSEHLAAGNPARASRAANDLGLLTDRGSATPPEDLEASWRWYDFAAQLAALAFDRHGERRSLNNAGRMRLWQGNFEGAIEAWTRAAALARVLGESESIRRVHANLALAWLIRAEGGFGGSPEVVLDPAADARAHAHLLTATRAARQVGLELESVCEAWGGWADRCDRVRAADAGVR